MADTREATEKRLRSLQRDVKQHGVFGAYEANQLLEILLDSMGAKPLPEEPIQPPPATTTAAETTEQKGVSTDDEE